MAINLEEVITLLKGELLVDKTDKIKDIHHIEIEGLATLETAKSGDICVYHNPKYYQEALKSGASVIITKDQIKFPPNENTPIQLLVANPYASWAKLGELFHPKMHSYNSISKDADIHETSSLGEGVVVYPRVFIDKKASIGPRCVIYPGVFIGQGVVIGSDTIIYSNVSIMENVKIGNYVIVQPGAVIGGDGFGFAPDGDEIIKVPQTGSVCIGNHVEIGSNVCIDKASKGDTIIEDFVKLDNLIQIGHGVKIGRASMIAAQFGAAGGAEIGKNFLCGGQSSIIGHLKIPDRVTCGGKSAITKVPDSGTTVMGVPSMPANEWRRLQVYLKKLPELFNQVKSLIGQINRSSGVLSKSKETLKKNLKE